MKDFLKYTLATVTGIIAVSAVIMFLGIISLIGMLASEQSKPKVKDNSVFVLSLSGAMQERSEDDVFSQITGNAPAVVGLEDVLNSIRKAKDDDNIKGIYIEAGMLSADSYASLAAIRNALLDFKKSGKWVVAYGDVYTQGVYYVASAADKVFLNPSGQVDWHGIASQPIFLKDVMAKFGVKMQLAKVGAYKSAPEMFTADKMSDANREQVTSYLNDIWRTMLADVAVCDGLIIDVRHNGGGTLTNATRLAARFTNERVLTGYILHKTGKGHSDFSDPEPVWLEPSPRLRWQKNCVVLCNRRSYSATNEFVNAMRTLPRVTTMGDRTGGGAGLPMSSELPNGWSVRYSSSPHLDAEGKHIEFGIEPDVRVALLDDDVTRGRDTLIEQARAYLKAQQGN